MNKLVLFKHGDYKTFTFSIAQYINLEIEYNRYIVYKELITTIENLLIVKKIYNNNTSENIKHKIYENKNILDRFILECINHGISPNIYNSKNQCSVLSQDNTNYTHNTHNTHNKHILKQTHPLPVAIQSLHVNNNFKKDNVNVLHSITLLSSVVNSKSISLNIDAPDKLNNQSNSDNIDNIDNITNTDNMDNITNTDNMDNMDNITNTDNMDNFTNIDNMDNITDTDNMDNITNMNNMDNIDNMDNLSNMDNMDNIDNIDRTKYLQNNFLFNKFINSVETLRKCVYFNKMLTEYSEKHIKISPYILCKLEKCIIDANNKFIIMNDKLFINICNKNTTKFRDIVCSIYIDAKENYLLTYRNYTKTINFNRYSKLINNYNRPYPYDIIKMILRYSIFDSSNQQWSIGINLYEQISVLFDISFEMFASPLNFNINMYCSLFGDTDKIFGSIGSFYNITFDKLINQNIKGVFYNPPYLPILMCHTIKICLDLLYKMYKHNLDFTIISFLPNWSDSVYIQSLLKSKYLVNYKVIKKGDYLLHEKDKGKLIHGTFELLCIVLNSKKTKWNKTQSDIVNKNFNDIIKLMKDETMCK